MQFTIKIDNKFIVYWNFQYKTDTQYLQCSIICIQCSIICILSNMLNIYCGCRNVHAVYVCVIHVFQISMKISTS